MKVAKNYLTQSDIDADPTVSITSNLLTEIGEIVITKDNELFQAKETYSQAFYSKDGELYFTSDLRGYYTEE